MGKRAQRIPSWPGVIHSNKGRIHLRRPTCDILTFRLRRSGGPYIPVCSSSTKNGEGLLLQLKSAADFVRAVEWTASRPSYGYAPVKPTSVAPNDKTDAVCSAHLPYTGRACDAEEH